MKKLTLLLTLCLTTTTLIACGNQATNHSNTASKVYRLCLKLLV